MYGDACRVQRLVGGDAVVVSTPAGGSEVLAFLPTRPYPFVDWFEVANAQPPGPADQHAADLCLWWAGELLGGQLTVGWSDTIDITADVKRWILEDAPARLERVPAEPRLTEYLEFLTAD